MTTATTPDTKRAATLFHALSDELRLEIILMVLEGERCVCELTEELGIAQSRLSWHLKTLKDAEILNDRREGRWVYYSLNPDALGEARAMLDALKLSSRGLASRAKCCD